MGYGYHIKGLWTVKKCGKLHEFPCIFVKKCIDRIV